MGPLPAGEPSWGFMKGHRPGPLLALEGKSHGGLVWKISGRISGDQQRH
jgi:hypothetical protein